MKSTFFIAVVLLIVSSLNAQSLTYEELQTPEFVEIDGVYSSPNGEVYGYSAENLFIRNDSLSNWLKIPDKQYEPFIMAFLEDGTPLRINAGEHFIERDGEWHNIAQEHDIYFHPLSMAVRDNTIYCYKDDTLYVSNDKALTFRKYYDEYGTDIVDNILFREDTIVLIKSSYNSTNWKTRIDYYDSEFNFIDSIRIVDDFYFDYRANVEHDDHQLILGSSSAVYLPSMTDIPIKRKFAFSDKLRAFTYDNYLFYADNDSLMRIKIDQNFGSNLSEFVREISGFKRVIFSSGKLFFLTNHECFYIDDIGEDLRNLDLDFSSYRIHQVRKSSKNELYFSTRYKLFKIENNGGLKEVFSISRYEDAQIANFDLTDSDQIYLSFGSKGYFLDETYRIIPWANAFDESKIWGEKYLFVSEEDNLEIALNLDGGFYKHSILYNIYYRLNQTLYDSLTAFDIFQVRPDYEWTVVNDNFFISGGNTEGRLLLKFDVDNKSIDINQFSNHVSDVHFTNDNDLIYQLEIDDPDTLLFQTIKVEQIEADTLRGGMGPPGDLYISKYGSHQYIINASGEHFYRSNILDDFEKVEVDLKDIIQYNHGYQSSYDEIFIVADDQRLFRASMKDPLLQSEDLEDAEFEVLLYPNPANEYLVVSLSEEVKGDVIVYNNLGRIIKKEKLSGRLLQLDLTGIKSGQYYVLVQDDHALGKKLLSKFIRH